MSKWHDDAVTFGATHIYCDDSSSATVDTVGSLDMAGLGTSPTAVVDGPRGRPAWRWAANGSLYHAPNAGFPQSNTFSLETWVRFDEDAAFQTASMIRSSTDDEVGGHSFGAGALEVLGVDYSTKGQHVVRRGGRSLLSLTGMGNNRWHQVVATVDALNYCTVYVDGTYQTGYSMRTPSGTAGFRVAANGYVPGSEIQRWDGDISSVAIYPRVLTPGEVWVLWGAKRPRAYLGLVAVTR